MTFGVLRERAFALLFSAQLISTTGDMVASIAVPFAILGLGGGAGDIGWVLAARAVPLVLFLLVGGVWADRLPRRTVMIASDAIRAACQAVFALLLFTGTGGIVAIAVIMFVYGSAEAFFRPAMSGVMPQAVSTERLQEAYGLIAVTPAVGMVLGGVLGGTIVALVSPAGAIAFDAASFVVGIVLLAFARFRKVATAEPGRRFLADLHDGWNAFRTRTWLVVVVVAESFYALLVMPAILVGGPIVSEQELGGAGAWAVIITAFGVGFISGGLIAQRLRPRHPLVLAYGVTVVFVGAFASLAIPASVAVIAVASWAGATCIAISGTLLETTITRQVTPDLRSRVGAFRALGSQVMQPVGYAAIGAIIAGVGLAGVMWLAAAAILANVALVLGTPSVRHLDDSSPGLSEDGAAATG